MTGKQGDYARLLAIATAVITVDQITKGLALDGLSDGPISLIRGVLALRLTFNPGGAFGILGNATWIFLIAGFAIATLIVVWVGRLDDPSLVVPLALVLGGGLGNLSDRLFRDLEGHVVDFIDLSFWPTFNVADIAISFGVILIVINGMRQRPDGAEA